MDFAENLVEQFELLFPHLILRACDTPISLDLREGLMEAKKRPSKRDVQKMIVGLLRLCRCAQHNLAFGILQLSMRTNNWNEACEAQLRRMMGFVKATAEYGLTMRWTADIEAHYCIWVDSDLAVPKC